MRVQSQNISKRKRKSFVDFCRFDAWREKNSEDKDDYFVGLKIENGEPRIYFPMGYRPNGADATELNAELKKDYFLLLSLLADKSLPDYFTKEDLQKSKLDFPIHAFLGVLQYYQRFGYYIEREEIYRKGKTGKINWAKTIKNIKPQVVKNSNGRRQIVYLDLITRKLCEKENNLITLIHKFCVYEAIQLIGPVFNFGEDEIEPIEEPPDYRLFIEIIQEKLSSSFNDQNIELFQNMLLVVKYMADDPLEGGQNSADCFGVNTFAPVWQMMVDRIFGTVSLEEKKEYYPNLIFKKNGQKGEEIYKEANNAIDEKKRSTLFPDTIMRINKSLFILDAKYYKFGVVKKNSTHYLPGAESVCKQMAYAEYVELQTQRKKGAAQDEKNAAFKGISSKLIYNAFVMPYCAEKEKNVPTLRFNMQNKGFMYGNWKNVQDADRPYHNIACVLLDTKSVMRNVAPSSAARKQLGKLIQDELKASVSMNPRKPKKTKSRKRRSRK